MRRLKGEADFESSLVIYKDSPDYREFISALDNGSRSKKFTKALKILDTIQCMKHSIILKSDLESKISRSALDGLIDARAERIMRLHIPEFMQYLDSIRLLEL